MKILLIVKNFDIYFNSQDFHLEFIHNFTYGFGRCELLDLRTNAMNMAIEMSIDAGSEIPILTII